MAAAVRLLLLLLLPPPPDLSLGLLPCLPTALWSSSQVLRITGLRVVGLLLLLLSLCARPECNAAACLCGGPLGGVVLCLVAGGSGSLGGGQSLRAGPGGSDVRCLFNTSYRHALHRSARLSACVLCGGLKLRMPAHMPFLLLLPLSSRFRHLLAVFVTPFRHHISA